MTKRLAVSALALLCVRPALSGEEGPNEDPSAQGSTGLFTVPRASTLGAKRVAFGVFYELVAREEGSSNVERGGITGAFGIGERLEVFVSFEPRVAIRRDFLVENASGLPQVFAPRLDDHPFAASHIQHGGGDLRAGAKVKLLGVPSSYDGLAVQGIVKLHTANTDNGIGTGRMDFGGDVIGSFEAARTLGLNGYVGLNFKGDPDVVPLADELRWGGGVQVPSRSWIQAIGEIYGIRYVRKPEFFDSRNYAILQGGVRLTFRNGLAVSGGLNRNLSIAEPLGVNPEKLGSFMQLSFSPRPPAPVAEQPPARRATLACRAESPVIRRGESVRVHAEGRDAEGNPIPVRWTASGGTIAPATGDSATWSASGEVRTTTITATASDGQGGSITCTVSVRIEEPPSPAAPTVRRSSCSEFVVRSARIDNRCKAVLDDVAVQLRSNPGATVRITGHGDASGAAAGSLGSQRAQNAMNYLVQTHGVDRSRVTAESSAEPGRRIDIEITLP